MAPLEVKYAGASVFVMLMPFMEQTANYNIIADWQNGPADNPRLRGFDQDLANSGDGDTQFWRNAVHMTNERRASLSSIPYVLCPTRRSGRQGVALGGAEIPHGGTRCNVAANDNIRAYGPFSDYAPVIFVSYESARGTSHRWNNKQDGVDHHWVALTNNGENSMAPDATEGRFNLAPFRRATIPGAGAGSGDGNGRQWQVRDSFSWWRDGTSNQIIFGEKHIPSNGSIGDGSTAWRHDQSFLSAADSNGRDWAVGRTVASTIPLSKATDGGSPRSQRTFGSWHPGICNFLIGDGAIRSVSVSTSGEVLGFLANVRSGRSASL
jgi:hypothetical protein